MHAAALGAEGKLLFVANMLPACRATDGVVKVAPDGLPVRTART